MSDNEKDPIDNSAAEAGDTEVNTEKETQQPFFRDIRMESKKKAGE